MSPRAYRETVVRVGRGWRGLRGLYEAYYGLKPPIEEPESIQHREFAFQYFDSESYVRHLSFASLDELLDHLSSRPPLHAYYSVALYELPEARSMEEKGFMGAPLFFDIDVDHLEGCQGPLPSDDCLYEGLRAAMRLAAMAKRDLGARDTVVYFTGNRGFHVIAECSEDCMLMGREERREIAWYVAAEALDLDELFPAVRGGQYQPASPTPDDPGWRGWIAAHTPLPKPGLVDSLGPDWRQRIAGVVEELRAPIDMQVTQDPTRLSRIRGTLNGKASLLVERVARGWRPDYRRLSPFHGSVVARCRQDLEGPLLGYELGLREGEEAELPAGIAVTLYTKGLCELVEGEIVVRAGPSRGALQGGRRAPRVP